MTGPIDYKQLAEEFYLSLKSLEKFGSPLTIEQGRLMKKYEDLHKPKMTWYPNGGEYVMDVVNYENGRYVLFWGGWYCITGGKLYPVIEKDVINKLNQAYEELKKQPKRVMI